MNNVANQKGGKLSGAGSVHKLFIATPTNTKKNTEKTTSSFYDTHAPCSTFPLLPLKLNERFKFQENVLDF